MFHKKKLTFGCALSVLGPKRKSCQQYKQTNDIPCSVTKGSQPRKPKETQERSGQSSTLKQKSWRWCRWWEGERRPADQALFSPPARHSPGFPFQNINTSTGPLRDPILKQFISRMLIGCFSARSLGSCADWQGITS